MGQDNCVVGGNFAREWNARVFSFGGKAAKPRGDWQGVKLIADNNLKT